MLGQAARTQSLPMVRFAGGMLDAYIPAMLQRIMAPGEKNSSTNARQNSMLLSCKWQLRLGSQVRTSDPERRVAEIYIPERRGRFHCQPLDGASGR